MLDGAASEELVRPEWVLASWADNDTPEQFSVTNEYTDQGAIAVVSLKPELDTYDVSLQELVLELRMGKVLIATQQVSIDLAEERFQDAFLTDRLRVATEETAAASLAETRNWLDKIDSAGEFTDLKLASGAESGAADNETLEVLSESTARLAAIAKHEVTNGAALSDVAKTLAFYRALDRAIDDTVAAQEAIASQEDQEAVDQQFRDLGNTTLLLAASIGQDAASGDAELAAVAHSLRSKILSATHSYFTIFSGLGQNRVLKEWTSSGTEYAIAAVEEPVYSGNPWLRIELGSQAAFVETSKPVGGTSGELSSLGNSSYGVIVGDTFTLDAAPGTAYGASDPGTWEWHLYAGEFGSASLDAYIQMDLANQVGKRVSEAELQLETLELFGSTTNIQLEISAHRDLFGLTAAGGFDEEAMTWNNRAATFGGFSGDYEENFSDPLATWQATVGTAAYAVTEAVVRATMAGDSNLNGAIDLAGWRGDVEAFYLAVHDWDTYVEVYGPLATSETELIYANDVNWDGIVDAADWDWMMQRWGRLKGDVTLDGQVTQADLSRWADNVGYGAAVGYGPSGFGYGGYSAGDTNADGDVDGADYFDIFADIGMSATSPLSPLATFRITPGPGATAGYAQFASSENSGADIPALLAQHDADIEVTDFSTYGTDFRVRYSVYNQALSGVQAQFFRQGPDGQVEDNPFMTQTVSASLGNHDLVITPDFAETANQKNLDYRILVRVVEATPTLESDLSDNDRYFSGGVFVNVDDDSIHVHGSESADTISITNDGIEIAGERGAAFGFGAGSDPTFVDDDGGPDLTDSAAHPGGRYQATAGISSPLVNHASTWGNDREIAYPDDNVLGQLASWTFSNLAPGVYQVSAVWQGHSNRATDATYRIYDGEEIVRVEHRSHQQHSSWTGDGIPVRFATHSSVSGVSVGFKDIGSPVRVTSGTLRVELPNALVGQVVADAIRLERIDVIDPLTSGGVFIRGQGGDDFISAAADLAFAITAFGGYGEDTLIGGAQGDVLSGGMGADVLFGGVGDDHLYGAYPRVYTVVDPDPMNYEELLYQEIVRDDGADTLYGDEGEDRLYVDYANASGDPTVAGRRYTPVGGDIFDLLSGDTIVPQQSLKLDGSGLEAIAAELPVASTWNQGLLWDGDYGFGEGWNLPGIDRLEFTGDAENPTSLTWVRSDGHAVSLEENGGQWTAESGDPSRRTIEIQSTGSVWFDVSDKYGSVAKYVVASSGLALLSEVLDRNGNGYGYVYDSSDATKISEMRIVRNGQEDEVVTFGYAPVTVGAGTEDRVTTITDPFGRVVDLSYHNDGRLHSIELPQIAAAIGYNVIGLVSLRPTTSFTYDGDYISQIDEPDHYTETGFGNLNIVRNYSWNDGELWVEDADPNPVRHVGAPTDVYMRWADLTGGWRFALPAFMLTDGLAPLSSEATQIGYTIDELGRTTVREYNRDGSLVRLELSTGAVVESDVNGAGLPTLVTTQAPGDGRIVDEMALAYDTSFNLVTVSHFDGSEESWTYGVNAQRTSETDEAGRTTLYTLDTWGNILTTRVVVGEDDTVVATESDDMVTSYEYSPDGLVIQSVEFRTDVNGTPQTSLVTQYEYTTVADTYSGGVLESHTGRWLAVTRYGGDDPLVSGISAPLTNESSIEVLQRDVYGNAVEVSDELGRITTYAYDALDRLRQVMSPDPGNGQSRERTDITYTTRGALAYRVSGGEGDVIELNGEWGNLNSPDYNDVPGSSEVLAALLIYPSGTATKARGDVYNYSICDCDCPTIESLNCLNFPFFSEELTSKTMTSRNPDGSTSSVTGPEGQEQAYDYGSTSGMLVRLTTSAASGSEALASFSGEAGAWGEGASDKGDIILQYNARGERIAMRDGSGRIVRYEYDARGRLIATIHSNGDRATLAYNAAGDLIESTDALDRSTRFEYDDAGRLSSMTEPGQALATTYQYDSAGQLRVMTDQLGRETETIYDERGRVVEEIDPNNQSVVYTYYDDNQLESLTDPEQNTTTWTYDLAGRLASETNELTHSESYRYDGFGNLVKLTDRNGRIVAYTYDTLHNLDLERWYSNETDFENNVYSYEIDYDFDHSSRLTRVRDDATGFDYQYVYDGLDRLQSIEMVLAGLSETVNIDRDLDGAGRVTIRSVNLGGLLNSGGSNDDEFVEGAAEFINAYAYDSSGRLATLTQGAQDVSGAREVAEKRVDFNWNAAGQLYTVSRFGDIDATPASAAAHSVLTYDVVGRIAGIQHRQGMGVAGSMIAGYQYGYDQSHRLTALDFLPSAYDDEDVSFTYDTRGQLTGADYAGSGLLDEAYDYDDNGNREGSQTTGVGSSTYAAAGTNNRLTDDGVYIYDYDNAGNRQFRTSKADGSATRYYWDHRDRLVKVAEFTTLLQAIAGASPTKVVEHRYDAFNQWIGATVDADGVGGGTAAQTVYVYDDGQIILQFDGAASGPLDGGDLSHRYLWGPMVDQILADEQVDWSNTYADGDVLWALTDHLGTVRDIVDDAGTLDSHRVYDSFGNVVDETVGAKDFLFGYTGKAFDEETGLQNNLNRWYDAKVGRWMSEDPIGFAANSANLVGYVDNTPTLAIDPSGLIEVFPRRLPPPPDDPVLLPDPDVPLSDPKNPMSDGPLYNPTIGPLSDYCLPTPTDHDPFSLKLWDRGWIPGGRIRLNPDLGNPGIIIYGGPNLPGSPVRGSMSPDGTWTPLHPGCDVDDRPGSVQEAERNVNELIREGDLPWLQEHLQRLEEMRRRLRR